MREDLGDDQRVLGVEAALERFLERGDLLAQLPAGQLGEHGRVGRAGNERVQHVAAGLAEDVGCDAVELDAGVLEDLVQAGGLALAVVDLRLSLPGVSPSASSGRADPPGPPRMHVLP